MGGAPTAEAPRTPRRAASRGGLSARHHGRGKALIAPTASPGGAQRGPIKAPPVSPFNQFPIWARLRARGEKSARKGGRAPMEPGRLPPRARHRRAGRGQLQTTSRRHSLVTTSRLIALLVTRITDQASRIGDGQRRLKAKRRNICYDRLTIHRQITHILSKQRETA